MVLVQRGAVDLNHPVNDYLGRAKLTGFGGDAAAATVKLVLQHKAGLAIHGNSFYADEAYRRPSLDETIMRYGIIVRPPGEAYNYSNLGFGVIERVIERTSGSKFEDFMRTEVFQPLGLDRTSVGPMTPLEEQTAVGYDDGKRLSERPDTDARGAGYIYSSVNDLVRFGMFRLKEHLPGQRQILSDSMIDRMANDTTPTGSAGSETYENGLGWAITHNASGSGLTITGHTGAGLGGAGVLWLVPEKRIAVAVLANSIRAGTVSLTMDIFDLLIPELKAQRAKNALSSQPSIPKAAFRPPPELIGSWKGEVDTWNGKIPVRMEVRTDGDIHIKMGDQWDTLETLLNNVQFHDGELSGSFAGIIPTEDANRHHYNVLLDRLVLRGDTLSGAAVADAGPYYALASWIKLVRQAPAK